MAIQSDSLPVFPVSASPRNMPQTVCSSLGGTKDRSPLMKLLPFVRSSTSSRRLPRAALVGVMGVAAMTLVATPAGALTSLGSFVGPGTTVSEIGPTIPANGDVNPYGVAVVAKSQGTEVAGDVLVGNFNSR